MPPLARRYEAAACYACSYGLQLRAKGWHRIQDPFFRAHGIENMENIAVPRGIQGFCGLGAPCLELRVTGIRQWGLYLAPSLRVCTRVYSKMSRVPKDCGPSCGPCIEMLDLIL